jgi:hypothetical protein
LDRKVALTTFDRVVAWSLWALFLLMMLSGYMLTRGFIDRSWGFLAGLGDSNHGTIHCPLRNQVKIHASQVEDERRIARQSCSHLGGHPDFPAHTLLGSLLWNRLIIHRPCGDLARDRRFSILHVVWNRSPPLSGGHFTTTGSRFS